MIIYALIIYQALFGNVYQLGDEELEVESFESATQLFRDVCVTPFPDSKGFHAAVRSSKFKLQQVSSDDVAMVKAGSKLGASPGELWKSKKYHIRYFSSGDFASPVPQPQCSVTVRLQGPTNQGVLVEYVNNFLQVKDPQVPPKKTPRVTYWDISPQQHHWRILLKSEVSTRGNFMSLTLLNLQKM